MDVLYVIEIVFMVINIMKICGNNLLMFMLEVVDVILFVIERRLSLYRS